MEILLVGNKNDLESERVITFEQGEKVAKENGLSFIEINAKDYPKVESAFKKVAEGILDKLEKGAIPMSHGNGIKTGDQ